MNQKKIKTKSSETKTPSLLAAKWPYSPNTVFLLNSVLLADDSRYSWLNNEIYDLNDHLKQLCRNLPNFNFLDTHQLLLDSNHRDLPRIRDTNSRDGIHISSDAVRYIGKFLVDKVDRLCKRHGGLGEPRGALTDSGGSSD